MPRGAGGAPVVVAAVPLCQLLCCGDFSWVVPPFQCAFSGDGLAAVRCSSLVDVA